MARAPDIPKITFSVKKHVFAREKTFTLSNILFMNNVEAIKKALARERDVGIEWHRMVFTYGPEKKIMLDHLPMVSSCFWPDFGSGKIDWLQDSSIVAIDFLVEVYYTDFWW